MENEKLFGFIRKRGTLGILTLVLVGVVAFASYRTSYPVTTQTEMQETENEKTQTETEASAKIAASLPQSTGVQESITSEEEKAAAVNSTSADAALKDSEAEEKTEMQKEETQKTKGSEESEKSTKEKEADPVLSGNVISSTVQFSEDASLTWPTAGSILMDYSMDGTVYFKTLNEYKYNPALIIGSATGNPVVASAKGIVKNISVNEETGITLTMNIGDDYELIYGELKDVAVAEGEVVEQGQLLGYVSDPTKYYCEEGSNLYFAMKKDGQMVDPCLYLE